MPRNQISNVQTLLTNVSSTKNAILRKLTTPRLNSANNFSTIALTIASGKNDLLVISEPLSSFLI